MTSRYRKENIMLMVIADHGDDYVVTNKKNYESYVQNARQIHRFPKTEWTVESIIDYYCRHFSSKESDFIIKQ